MPAFIPVVPSGAPTPPSPRTRELAGLLTKVLDEYQKSHPAVTPTEMRAAVRLAQSSVKGGGPVIPLAVSLGLGLLVAGLMAGLLFVRSGGDVAQWTSAPIAIFVLVALIALIMVLVLKSVSR